MPGKERDEGEESRERKRREVGGKEERLGEGGGCGWEENRKVQEDKGGGGQKEVEVEGRRGRKAMR